MIALRRHQALPPFLSGIFVAFICNVVAQRPPSDSQQLLRAGLALEMQAASAASTADAPRYLQEAIEKFRAAVQINPSFGPAHAQWSNCLIALARLSKDSQQRRDNVRAAVQQFAVAASCAGTDWTVFRAWGQVILLDPDSLANTDEERRGILDEARTAFESGLKLARFSAQRAEIEIDLGRCLAALAGATADTLQKVELYKQSIARFGSATTTKPELRTTAVQSAWGQSLVSLGRWSNDPPTIRLGADRFQEALRTNAKDARLHFDLACAYALLNEPNKALLHLRECFEYDPRDTVLEMAANDPDLQQMHGNPEFDQLTHRSVSAPNPRELYLLGAEQQRLAMVSKTPDDQIVFYEKAISYLREAASARPDLLAAQVGWAQCLYSLASLSTAPTERRALFQASRDRWVIAAGCHDADCKTYEALGEILLSQLTSLASSDQQRRNQLEQARQAFERGFQLARFSGERTLLLGDLGRCYITLAEYVPNAEERQQLQRDGINQFATAEKERPGALMASSYELWGTTLLQLSKIQMDRQLQRSAVEFLLKAIALAPSDGRAHYNLACCYALLNEHEPAIRHLRLCLETDPLGQRRQSAAEDADLKSLRNQPEFVKLLAPRPGVGTSTPALKR